MIPERKIVAGLFTSLDGVVEAPETWHFPYMDREMDAAVGQMHAEADTLLVASTTLRDAGWNNAAVIDGDVIAAVKELKRQPGTNVNLSGSISLTRALLEAGLLDELRLLVHPIVLGTGQRLFPEGTARTPLTLARSTTYASGVMDLIYQPA